MTLEDWESSVFHILKAQKKHVLFLETERGMVTGKIISVELGHEDYPSLLCFWDNRTGERVLSFRQILRIIADDKIIWDREDLQQK